MVALPLATSITAFHVVGGLTALWAVLLAFLGLSNHNFPRAGLDRLLMAIGVLLAAGSIGTAIGTAKGPARAAAAAPAAAGAAQKLTLTADPSGALKFDKTTLSAGTGAVEIALSNPAPLGHNIALQGQGVSLQGPTVGHGGTSTVTGKLRAGTYTFYCAVPGHRQAGMQGTLTVK